MSTIVPVWQMTPNDKPYWIHQNMMDIDSDLEPNIMAVQETYQPSMSTPKPIATKTEDGIVVANHKYRYVTMLKI